MTTTTLDPNLATGLCLCGCGQATRIAARSHTRYGQVRGRPLRYIKGHNATEASAEQARKARSVPPATGPQVKQRCLHCDYPVMRGGRILRGYRALANRGLCSRCRRDLNGTDELYDYPARCRSRDEVLDEWDRLRLDGVGRAQAAQRMGMTFGALDRAIHRGRNVGDPRAVLGNP